MAAAAAAAAAAAEVATDATYQQQMVSAPYNLLLESLIQTYCSPEQFTES